MIPQATLDQLDRFHRAYLSTRGIEFNAKGRWKCFVHYETAPSCNFVPGTDERLWHCHGCGLTASIFDSCHYLEGKPPSGPGWYKETFCYLANEFGVEIPAPGRELTSEEQHQLLIEQAFERTARLVISMKHSDAVRSKLADYGWSATTLRQFGIGGVTSYQAYLDVMAEAGFSKKLLEEIGLADGRIFREQSLVFTIKDPNGRPIAFAGRNLCFEKEEAALSNLEKDTPAYKALEAQRVPKYVNTRFAKGEVLFGFDRVRGSRSLYIFEGNADCVTAHNAGLVNSVAVCGSRFNEHHLKLALDNGVRHFICCFDADAGGQNGKQKFAEFFAEQLAGLPNVRAELIDLPLGEGQKKIDPDEYIQKFGLKAFRSLPRRSHFYWAVRHATETRDRLEVVTDHIQDILRQPDVLLRYDMLCQLADAATMPPEFVWEGVLAQAAKQDDPIGRQIQEAGRRMLLFREQPAEVKAILTETVPPPAAAPVALKLEPKPASAPVRTSLLVSACPPSSEEHKRSTNQATTAAANQW